MAERKIIKVEEEKSKKKTNLNIDLSELKKIGLAILSFIAANPELVSKLLNKPTTYLKKIVNGENVSKDTKKKVNKTINDNKNGGIASILTSLGNLSGDDKETTNIFKDISKKVTTAKVGSDVANVLGGLLNSSSSSKKGKKKNASSSGLAGIFQSLFK